MFASTFQQDAQWLKSLPLVLDFYVEDCPWSYSNVNEPTPPIAEYLGQARTPHGGTAGGLYGYEGKTYLVPRSAAHGAQIIAPLSQAQEVTSNPTGHYADMTLAPIDPVTLQGGLTDALQAAIDLRNRRAKTENRLAYV